MALEGDDFSNRDFRRAVWHQTATTVAMLTAVDEAGEANVMACEWAMMVSTSPMRFVISVGPQHVTHDLITRTGEFGLNFCSDDQANLSHVSGSYSMRDTDKWSLADFPTYAAKKIRPPMVDGCALNVECKVTATQPLGDHTVFIGEAVWAKCNADAEPLIYHGGKYFHIGAQLPKD